MRIHLFLSLFLLLLLCCSFDQMTKYSPLAVTVLVKKKHSMPRIVPKQRFVHTIVGDEVEHGQEHLVKRILDHRCILKNTFFLVEWHDEDLSEYTWEPLHNLLDCEQLLQDYFSRKHKHALTSSLLYQASST